jgi:hypothetical protein
MPFALADNDREDGSVKSTYAESLSVASSATSDIITYTVPAGKLAYPMRVEMGGSNIATYSVLLNAATIAKSRTYFGGNLTTSVQFGEEAGDTFTMQAGDVLIVRVSNFRPMVGDFEARLQYIESY